MSHVLLPGKRIKRLFGKCRISCSSGSYYKLCLADWNPGCCVLAISESPDPKVRQGDVDEDDTLELWKQVGPGRW